MKIMKKFFLLSILLSVNTIYAQFVWSDMIYSPLVKTVKLENPDAEFSIPIVNVNQSEGLVLSFDELTEQTNRFEYTFVHCNSDWTQSELQPYEYIDGFETALIENYANSINTIQRYVHYEQKIPNSDTRLMKSGNYILKVFREGEPENVVFTRRFYCMDDMAGVSVNVMQAREPSLRDNSQEIDVFVVSRDELTFNNPQTNIKVAVQQNGRTDNMRFLPLKESRGVELVYSYFPQNVFEAGNVFRNFDFTSLRTRSSYVENMDFLGGENIVRLKKEIVKDKSPYVFYGDIDGAYYIRNDVGETPALGSDYAWVYFYLPLPISLEGSYYAVGEMSDWRMSELNKFNFDSDLGMYVLRMLLKQGYYNYQILYRPHNTVVGQYRSVEGNHSETNNRYNVFVYYRNLGDNYDSFIGFSSVTYQP